MQRGEGDALSDGGHDIVVNADGSGEFLAAVDDTVADSADLRHVLDHAVLCGGQLIQNCSDGLGMCGHGDVLIKNGLAVLGFMGEVTVDADALAQAFSQQLLAVHVEQLILQRGTSAVDDKNFHSRFLSSCKIIKKE